MRGPEVDVPAELVALRALAKVGCPTATPHTWLLSIGWRRGGGLIAIDDVPGPAP